MITSNSFPKLHSGMYLTGYAIRTTLKLSKAPKLMGKSWSLFVDTSPVLSGSQLLPNILPWNLCKFFFLFYQVQLHKWPRKLQLRRWTESRKSEIGDTAILLCNDDTIDYYMGRMQCSQNLSDKKLKTLLYYVEIQAKLSLLFCLLFLSAITQWPCLTFKVTSFWKVCPTST